MKSFAGIKWFHFFWILGGLLFMSCSEIEKDETLSPKRRFPTRIIKKADFTLKDSSKVKMTLKAPIVYEFLEGSTTYMIFPKGLEMSYYDIKNKKPSYLRAKWAKVNEFSGYYQGRKGVLMINATGDTLRTKSLVWQKQTNQIYTTDPVSIRRLDGTFLDSKNGIRSNQEFTRYTLYQNKGELKIEDKN
ncbi:MAG: LPS export ABC transporter periplasmic protein LptC [Flavobacteriaceae bacterium]|nr:MAG: LPS export ABC transporter periplasmic protein LptC [Flavobacteriaceae bacterium]